MIGPKTLRWFPKCPQELSLCLVRLILKKGCELCNRENVLDTEASLEEG